MYNKEEKSDEKLKRKKNDKEELNIQNNTSVRNKKG